MADKELTGQCPPVVWGGWTLALSSFVLNVLGSASETQDHEVIP